MQMAQVTVNVGYSLAHSIRDLLLDESSKRNISFTEKTGFFSSDFIVKAEVNDLRKVMSIIEDFYRRYKNA